MLDIIVAYAVNNLCYKTAAKMTPKGIVVHSTGGNNPTLKRYVDAPEDVGINPYGNHWNVEYPEGRGVCVHSFIGYDKDNRVRVAQILPYDICCWGVGAIPYDINGRELASGSSPGFHHYGPSYNFNPAYIQFEICEDGLTDKVYYRKAFDTAIEYSAELCRRYNIDVANVIGHQEAYRRGYGCNHADPEHWMKIHGETMDDFRAAVSAILKNNYDKRENETESDSKAHSGNCKLEKGDLVSITPGAVYYNGKIVPDWVIAQNWYIREEPIGERFLIDKNESFTHSICSPIHRKYLTLVKKADNIGNTCSNPSTTKSCPYLVKILSNPLIIREKAGGNSTEAGRITDGGVYTIVEEKTADNGSIWGKLKSGAGWIPLDEVKKL